MTRLNLDPMSRRFSRLYAANICVAEKLLGSFANASTCLKLRTKSTDLVEHVKPRAIVVCTGRRLAYL